MGVRSYLHVCVCMCVCTVYVCLFSDTSIYTQETVERKKINFFYPVIFPSRKWKMNSYIKCCTLSSLSILFLMKDSELCITFNTLWEEHNIKILLKVFLFFFSAERLLSGAVECILSKKSNYHSSPTMHSCKLWHYLCLLAYRGETEEERRDEVERGQGENEEKGCRIKDTYTHTLAWNQWRRLCLALSSRACQIYFQHQGTLCCLLPHPSVPCLGSGFLCGQCYGWRLGVDTYRMMEKVCVCVCTCMVVGVCVQEEGIWNWSGCQGTQAHGILHHLASQSATGAQVLGKSPAEVKSTVIEMKRGSPTPLHPTHWSMGEKWKRQQMREGSEGAGFRECKIVLTVFHVNMFHIWNPYYRLSVCVCVCGGGAFIVQGNVPSHTHMHTNSQAHPSIQHARAPVPHHPPLLFCMM